MTRTMYDSLNPDAIPLDAELVASYIDGANAPAPGWQQRFPSSRVVEIARNSTTNAGQVGDVESTDMTPQGAVAWVRLRRAAGQVPTVYCNDSTLPAVQAAFQAAGEPMPEVWLAHWGEAPNLPAGAVAFQYANSTMTGHDYDLSVVADYWPGVDPAPDGSPAPAPELPLADTPQPGHRYTVKAGDTLSALALTAYGSAADWPDIWHANPSVQNPDLIYPGQVLVIPEKPGPLQTFRRYTVKAGDTLWGIAQAAYGSGAQWWRIYDANREAVDAGGGPGDIHPGLELVIPD